jgi:hypothetical protein
MQLLEALALRYSKPAATDECHRIAPRYLELVRELHSLTPHNKKDASHAVED